MTMSFFWNGRPVRFRPGESVAAALEREGIVMLGTADKGQARALFCGIGQCQNCLVVHEGCLVEACLLLASENMIVSSDGGARD